MKIIAVLVLLNALVLGYLSLYNATNWGISLGQGACLVQGGQGNTPLAGSVKEETARRKRDTQELAVLTVIAALAGGIALSIKKEEAGE